MKILKPHVFIFIVLFSAAISVYPQMKYGGRVVEIVDGKTCVIEMPNGKLTAVLQYIEVPDPEQPLHDTVKDHLKNLVLDKTVEFMPRNVLKTQTVGRLLVKGVDVSQQMLRDGAAWYSVDEQENHNEGEKLLYQNNESQARNEKRGVWGVPDLKPVWEYRAEKEAIQKKLEEDEWKQMVEKQRRASGTQTRSNSSMQVEMWADVGGTSKFDKPLGYGGLRAGYDPSLKIGHVSTSSMYLDFPNAGFLQRVESRLFYFYKGDKTNVEDSIYLIGFLTISKNFMFAKSNSLTISADAQKFALGRARRFHQQGNNSVKELLLYRITRGQLLKIVNAQRTGIQIGAHKGEISSDYLMALNNLLNAS